MVTDIRMPPGHTDDGLRAALLIRREQAQDRRRRPVSHIYEQLNLPVSDDDHRRVIAVTQFLSR